MCVLVGGCGRGREGGRGGERETERVPVRLQVPITLLVSLVTCSTQEFLFTDLEKPQILLAFQLSFYFRPKPLPTFLSFLSNIPMAAIGDF